MFKTSPKAKAFASWRTQWKLKNTKAYGSRRRKNHWFRRRWAELWQPFLLLDLLSSSTPFLVFNHLTLLIHLFVSFYLSCVTRLLSPGLVIKKNCGIQNFNTSRLVICDYRRQCWLLSSDSNTMTVLCSFVGELVADSSQIC